MKSTLINMVGILFGITLVSSAAVGVVNMYTAEPIAVAAEKAVTDAVSAVLPPFDATSVEELTIDSMPIKVYTATAAGETVGYAVQTMTKSGFSGVVRLMVGFTPDGRINNINVLEQSETPGLGAKMKDDGNALYTSFVGKYPAQMTMKVRKDGGDVDALTAATISSRAYTDATARAFAAFEQVARTGESVTAAESETLTAEPAEEGENNE